MPILSKLAISNTVVTTGWTNPQNAYLDDGVYATAAPGKNVSITTDWGFAAFTDAELPAGSTINSATLEIQYKVSTTSSIVELGRQAVINGVVEGTETLSAAEPTTDTVLTLAVTGATESVLKTAGALAHRVRAKRGGSNTAVTFSLDYVKLTVDYAEGAAAISGSGGVSFGFATSGSGTVAAPSYTGSGGVAFGFSTSGSGTYTVPATPEVTGSGGVAFGFATAGTGTVVAPSYTGSGGVSFGFALDGTGTVVAPGVSGSGGVAFGFSTSGSGTYIAPAGPAAISGSGGVMFGFSTSGTGTYTAPADTPVYPEDGPWMSHGTIHLSRPPNH